MAMGIEPFYVNDIDARGLGFTDREIKKARKKDRKLQHKKYGQFTLYPKLKTN